MAVFISYSHDDAEFVDKLVWNLVASKVPVWIDKWEIHVGDSLIRKVEDAIQKADALVAILSKASVQSEWCRKEFTAGLVRELEERQVVVLPVLANDCDIPLFLREKKYADFRKGFDRGLRDIREALAKVMTDALGRIDEPRGFVDWSFAWSTDAKQAVTIHIIAAEHAKDQPYTTLTTIDITINDVASRRHRELVAAGFEPFAKQLILSSIAVVPELAATSVLIKDEWPVDQKLIIRDPKAGLEFAVYVQCRRLGQDTGRDILLHLGQQVQQMADQGLRVLQPAPEDRKAEFLEIMRKYRSELPFLI